MTALDTKLLRDLFRLRGQALTIVLVVGCGIAAYVSALTTYRSLVRSRDGYYASARFAHVFAHVQRAPLPLLDDVRAIPGVSAAEGRVVTELRLDVPGITEPVAGQAVSLEQPQLMNVLFLREGRLIAPGSDREVVVSELFAQAHGLRPGDALTAVIKGRRTELQVVGVGTSPEYVWVMGQGGPFPDERKFGVLWMDRHGLSRALGMEDAFNDVTLRLSPGASEGDVIDAVDRLLDPWGNSGAHGRDRQPSDRLVRQELSQLRGNATVLPVVFLGVAAFLLNVLLSRVIGLQREQIAALKALGYSNRQVGLHYLKLVLVIVVGGVAVGTALGVWGGRFFIRTYSRNFRFPELAFRLDALSIGTSVLISAGAATLGALAAVRRAVSLPPAEAMRPEPPARYRPTVLERLGLQRLISVAARMVVRDIERQPFRTLLSTVAIAFATAIIVSGNMGFDSIHLLMGIQFDHVQREDLTVTLAKPVPDQALTELAALPGVLRVEPLRLAPVRVRAGSRSRETAVTGLAPGGELRALLDTKLRPIALPPRGVALSRALGELLDVKPGDTVQLELLEGARPRRDVQVAELVDDLVGLSVYMPRESLAALFDERPLLNQVLLSADPAAGDALYAELERRPLVTSIERKNASRTRFREQTARVFTVFQMLLSSFAAVIAVGVVYNNVRIALSVRSRDLATLRILGFTRREVARILFGEQVVQLGVGILLGLPLGKWLGELAFRSVSRELFRFPLVVSERTRALAAGVILLAAALSLVLVRRRADRLDLVAVLKARD